MQLVSEISNLCGPESPTLRTDGRTDGRTDDMRSQYRALRYSASRGKNDDDDDDDDEEDCECTRHLTKYFRCQLSCSSSFDYYYIKTSRYSLNRFNRFNPLVPELF